MPRSDTSYSWYTLPSDYSDPLGLGDDRKCQVPDCFKKHGYLRRGNRKIYSLYCSDHTCAVFRESEGEHCSTPKERSERYCPDHLLCGEPGCPKMGLYIHNTTGEYIRWYCPKHRCASPDCFSRATVSEQQRCDAHVRPCSVPGCSRLAHRHRDGKLDVVCIIHYRTSKCHHEGCDRLVSTRYCPRHACVVDSCNSARARNAEACVEHLCQKPSCSKVVRYPNRTSSAHCAMHTCRAPSCTAPRIADGSSDFCPEHKCRTPGCRSEVEPPERYCPRHACVVVGCTLPRLSAATTGSSSSSGATLLAPGEDRDRCAGHSRFRERRSASAGAADAAAIDFDELRGRFDRGGYRRHDRWGRLSDDLDRLRRRERELDLEIAAINAEREREEEEWERLEKVRRELDELSGLGRRRTGL